jgi:hypothetical protein
MQRLLSAYFESISAAFFAAANFQITSISIPTSYQYVTLGGTFTAYVVVANTGLAAGTLTKLSRS